MIQVAKTSGADVKRVLLVWNRLKSFLAPSKKSNLLPSGSHYGTARGHAKTPRDLAPTAEEGGGEGEEGKAARSCENLVSI